LPDWRELSAKRNMSVVDTSSKTCSADSDQDIQSYISFQSPLLNHPLISRKQQHHNIINGMNMNLLTHHISTTTSCDHHAPSSASSSFSDLNDFIKHGDWDDLTSVEFAATDAHGPLFFM